MVTLKLPRKVHYKDVWKVLAKKGFEPISRVGSHIEFYRPRQSVDDLDRYVTLVCHKQIRVGTFKNIIRRSGIPIEEFLELL